MTANAIISAARTPRIRAKGSDAIIGALEQGYILKGVAVQKQSLIGTANVLGEQLPAEFPELRTGELTAAIRQGVTRIYGDDDYISAANILRWVRCYLSSNDRREALGEAERAAQRAREASELQTADPVERASRHSEFVRTAPTLEWNRYVQAQGEWQISTDGYAAAVYDALAELGKVHPTEETLRSARAQAEREVEAARRQSPHSYRRGLTAVTTCGSVEFRTKAILLELYFSALYKKGITPNFNKAEEGRLS